MMAYLICYDIESDRQRYRVAKRLEREGRRIQESVFECWFQTDQEMQHLKASLAEILGEAEEVRFYLLCANCRAGSFTLKGRPVVDAPGSLIL